jgi:dephospho-CoA kinase
MGCGTHMVVIGLTGGIACGKSTVAAMLEARGIPVVDADAVARDVVAPGAEGAEAVRARFGDGVMSPDGGVNRPALAARVFPVAEERAALNAILHPRIAAESAQRLQALGAQGHSIAVYDAALLVETGSWRAMEALMVVSCSPEVQRARLLARNGGDAADADARIAAQLPLAEKERVATWVLRNDGAVDALAARVDVVVAELRARYGGAA